VYEAEDAHEAGDERMDWMLYIDETGQFRESTEDVAVVGVLLPYGGIGARVGAGVEAGYTEEG